MTKTIIVHTASVVTGSHDQIVMGSYVRREAEIRARELREEYPDKIVRVERLEIKSPSGLGRG